MVDRSRMYGVRALAPIVRSDSFLACALLCLGIGFFRFWYQYNLYNMHFSTDVGVHNSVINLLRVVVTGVLLVVSLMNGLSPRARNALTVGSVALMVLSSTLAFADTALQSQGVGVARYVLCAVGIVWGGAIWMDGASRLAPPYAFASLVGGVALSCVFLLVGGLFSPATLGIVNIFVPVVAVVAYWWAGHIMDAGGFSPVRLSELRFSSIGDAGVSWRSLGLVAAALGLFSLVDGIAYGFPEGLPRALPESFQRVHQLVVFFVLAFVAVRVLRGCKAPSFMAIWIVLNALLAASVLLLAHEGAFAGDFGTAVLLTLDSFMTPFILVASYAIGIHGRWSPTFVLGVLYAGAYLLPLGVGRLLSLLTTAIPGGATVLLAIMALLAAVEIAVGLRVAIFRPDALPLDSFAGSGCDGKVVPEATAQQPLTNTKAKRDQREALLELCAQAGASPTETLVAELIVRGRSRSAIAEELGYSPNTVRNYTASLYRKLGIHVRQDLFDLLQDELCDTGASGGRQSR